MPRGRFPTRARQLCCVFGAGRRRISERFVLAGVARSSCRDARPSRIRFTARRLTPSRWLTSGAFADPGFRCSVCAPARAPLSAWHQSARCPAEHRSRRTWSVSQHGCSFTWQLPSNPPDITAFGTAWQCFAGLSIVTDLQFRSVQSPPLRAARWVVGVGFREAYLPSDSPVRRSELHSTQRLRSVTIDTMRRWHEQVRATKGGFRAR